MNMNPRKNKAPQSIHTAHQQISNLRSAMIIQSLLIVILLIPYGLIIVEDYQFKETYKEANFVFMEGDYFKALDLYQQMGNYKESQSRADLALQQMNEEIRFDEIMSKNREAIEKNLKLMPDHGENLSTEVLAASKTIFEDYKKNRTQLPVHTQAKDYKYQNYIELNEKFSQLLELYASQTKLGSSGLLKIENLKQDIEALLKALS